MLCYVVCGGPHDGVPALWVCGSSVSLVVPAVCHDVSIQLSVSIRALAREAGARLALLGSMLVLAWAFVVTWVFEEQITSDAPTALLAAQITKRVVPFGLHMRCFLA